MKLKLHDQIAVEVVQISSSKVIADSSAFSNVSQIIVRPQVAESVLSPGKKMVAEVESVEDGVATVEQVQAAYRRQHWAGDIVEVTARKLLRKGICRAEFASPNNLDYVIALSTVPEEMVNVELVKIRNGVGFGKVVERLSPGLQVGDKVLADISKGDDVAKVRKGSYDIHIDTYAPVPGSIRVKITDISDKVKGTIVGPSHYPIEGARVTGTISQGKKKARLNRYDSSVTLDKPAAASGPASLDLESVTESGVQAKVSEYDTMVPEEGDTVSAEVYVKNEKAEVTLGEMTIIVDLVYSAPFDGTANIELENASKGRYSGRLVKYTDKPIAPGKTHSGKVYTNTNRIITSPSGRSIYLTHNVETKGHANVKITKIENKVYGEIIGDINTDTERKERKKPEKFIGSKNSILNKSSL